MIRLKNIARLHLIGSIFFVFILSLPQYVSGQQYSNSGYHHDHGQQKATETDMPSICEHLQSLLKHHYHQDAHELIVETMRDNPVQPDCFYHNARIYFSHKLSTREKHNKHLFDSLLVMYDKWFASSRNPNEVLNNKGIDVRDYYYKQPDSLRRYCALYKRIYEADKENLHPYNLKMMAFCACDLYGKISIDTLWQVTKQKASKSHEHLWKASYKSLKRELIKCPKLSCNQLNGYLHPDLVLGKDGSEETQKVAALLVERGCPTPAGFVVKAPASSGESKSTATVTASAKPDNLPQAELTKAALAEQVSTSNYINLTRMADTYMLDKRYSDALDNYTLAVRSASSPIEKADGYLGMAIAADSLKDYKRAKEYGKTVHQLLPDETDGMRFLLHLYQKGEHTCHFETPKEQAALYILLSNIAWKLSSSEESDAWKEYANLGDLYKSGQAKKGDKVMVGCFIEEEVELP